MSSRSVAQLTIVGRAQHPVRKELIWVPKEGMDACLRTEGVECAWHKPSKFYLPDNRVSTFYTYLQHETPDLASRLELRKRLATSPNEALWLGTLAPGIQPGQQGRRNQKTLVDAPRQFLTADLDGLPFDGDVVEEDGRLHEALFELWEKIDEPALQADCILQLSSSHGLLNRREIRANIEWQLDEPMTLKEQKAYAQHLNAKLKAAGLPELFDTTIYESARLIFTSEPRLYKRTLDAVGDTEMPRLHVARVRMVHGTTRTLAKPVFKPVVDAVAHIRQLAGIKPKPGSGRLKEESVYKPLTARIMAVAARTPEHDLARVKEELREKLAAEILALGNETGKLEKRLKWVQDHAYTLSWDGAVKKRGVYLERPDDRPQIKGASVEAARQALADTMQRLRERVERRELGALLDSETGEVPPIWHVLVNAPPGIGKSYVAVESVFPNYITNHRVSYLVPRIDFGQETAELAHSFAPPPYHHELIRHHVGRKNVCSEPKFGALAEQFENLGRSPAKAVCTLCPAYDTCPWPKQREDTGAGFVVQQHAHLTSSMAQMTTQSKGAPNLTFADESIFDTLVGKEHRSSIKRLRYYQGKTVIRDEKGMMVTQRTADLVGFRKRLLDGIEDAGERFPTKHAAWLLEESTFNLGDKEFVRPILWYMRRLERRVLLEYGRDMAKAAAAGDHAALRHAAYRIDVANFFLELYRAIEASLNAGRPLVYGLRTIERKVIKVHVRHKIPPLWAQRDGISMDGTADFKLWQKMFVGTGVECFEWSLVVERGPYTLTQYADKPYSRSWIMKHPDHQDRLHRFILHAAARHPGVMVVAQKAVLPLLGPFPDNVMATHFKGPDTRGSNKFKDCTCCIVIGRAMPSATDLELRAEAFYFDDPESQEIHSVQGRVAMGTREIRVAGGQLATIACEQHPDPQVYMVQKQDMDAETRQCIDRLRLFDRTEDNPAEIHVFGQADTGLVVTRLARWADAERTKAEVLIAGGAFPVSWPLLRGAALGLLSALKDRQIAAVASEARDRLMYLARATSHAVTLDKYIGGSFFIQRHCMISCSSAKRWQLIRCRVTGLEGVPPLQDFWIDRAIGPDTATVIRRAMNWPSSVAVDELSVVAQSVTHSPHSDAQAA